MKHAMHLWLDEVVLSPGEEWLPAVQGWLFIRLQSGQAYWLSESVALDLGVGQLLILSPLRSGVVRASQMGRAQLSYFRFSPDHASGVLNLPEHQALDRAALKSALSPRLLAESHPASVLLGRICQGDAPRESLRTRALLLQVIGESFSWNLRVEAEEVGAAVPPSRRVRELIQRLTETELRDLAPEMLARQCGCSTQHFSRLFQAYYGVSLRTRQMELKMLRARQLLEATNLSVEEVARVMGSWQVGYFKTLFKKEFGVTPTEFRRQRRRALEMAGSDGAVDRGSSPIVTEK